MKTMLRLTFLFGLTILIMCFLNTKSIVKYQDYVLLMDINIPLIEEVLEEENETFYGTVTGYGPDCDGCIGITASGYDVRNTIYYNDKEYGNIRIVAADYKYPFGSIIKLSNINGYDDIIAIVLDRGSAIGNDKNSQIDLLFQSELDSYNFGRIHDVRLEVMRLGFGF